VNRSVDESDERLLAEFLDGDHQAFSQLVRRYDHELFLFVARFVRNSATAEDVVQETFIQVHRAAHGFDPKRRFRPWLFTIAANKARDLLRTKGRRREVALVSENADGEQMSFVDFLADAGPAPDCEVEAEEQRECVRRVVGKLPDHLREVLVLAYFQRLAYKEMAEVLGIPLGTVKSRLHAAVTKFADAFRREMSESTK